MSKESIEKIIKEEKPEVLGVELCETRFKIFTNPLENIREKDESLLGEITKGMKEKAEEEKLDYGSDMKTVMFYAINNNIPLVLVDKDILQIRKEMATIPLEEQKYLQNELMKFKSKPLQKEVDEEEIIKKMKEEIPTAYEILVEDRNKYITNKIKEAMEKFKDKKILIFLGKAHVKEVEGRLKNK